MVSGIPSSVKREGKDWVKIEEVNRIRSEGLNFGTMVETFSVLSYTKSLLTISVHL